MQSGECFEEEDISIVRLVSLLGGGCCLIEKTAYTIIIKIIVIYK